MIHEIISSDWPAFCRRISQERAGATVKLEAIEPDGVKTERFANVSFHSLVFDQTDACNDVITVHLGGSRETAYEIVDPIHLRLHPSGTPNDFNVLQIEAESGVTFITFHPAIHAQMLKNLKAD